METIVWIVLCGIPGWLFGWWCCEISRGRADAKAAWERRKSGRPGKS